jgi:hypothetical protein
VQDAILPYAFSASPFPLILSIENHCGREQQDVMAGHFREILGELLYTDPVDPARTELPSPEDLRNRILVKAKKIQLTATGSIDTEIEEDEEETEERVRVAKLSLREVFHHSAEQEDPPR